MKLTTEHSLSRLRGSLRMSGFLLISCGAALAASIPAAHAESRAPFVSSHQGFEHDTAGWYDGSDAGPFGWCGDITRIERGDAAAGDISPSAGNAFAAASFGGCNVFWQSLGVPFGAPYGPGPELNLAFNPIPAAGYVTDLDVYLDPAWSGSYQGNFEFAGVPATTLVQYAATMFEAGYLPGDLHTGPHYFVDVEALPGQSALSVGDYSVTEAGWYTFRFAFSDSEGDVRVDFHLIDRRGGLLTTVEAIDPTNLLGPFRTPFTNAVETADYTTGWVWFFDIAGGLSLPIDQHRQRPGR